MKQPRIRMKQVTVKAVQDGQEFTYQTFRITGTANGQRVRLQINDRDAARHELTRLQVAALNGGNLRPVMTRLSDARIAEAEAAYERLREAGKPLSFAVEWFLSNYREPRTALPISAVKDEFLADRASRGVEAVTLRDYRQAMTRFSEAMGAKAVPDITTDDVLAYLQKTSATRPKSWNNDRADLNAFFVWAMKSPRRWLDKNPVAEVEKRKVTRGLPETKTAEQVAEIMKHVEEHEAELAGYLALAWFSGIRPCSRTGELFKLLTHPRAGEFINFQTGYIVLSPEVTKTDLQRQVKMEPNLIAWLKKFPPQIPPNLCNRMTRLRKKFSMGKDVTRHTYVTMHAAAFESIGNTAQQAGNSESMIKRHYLNMITPAQAAKFWQIVPSGLIPRPSAKAS